MTFAQVKEKIITGDELAEMPDVERSELIDGVVVKMPPTSDSHGAVEKNTTFELEKHIRLSKTGYVRVGEVGIYIRRNPDTIRAADVVYISKERYAQRDPDSAYLTVAPELIVEVLSPSESFGTVTRKLEDYFSAGVKIVWAVDLEQRKVFVYRSVTEIQIVTEEEALTGGDVLPGLELPVANLFLDL